MAKGRRQLGELAKDIDIIIEVRDARAPNLSSSPLIKFFAPKIKIFVVLSKADLADEAITREWCDFFRRNDMPAVALDLRKHGAWRLKNALLELKPPFRDLHLAVVGIPNVGKSMLINQLAGRQAAAVGGVPGVTRCVSWFKGEGFLLLDSPGILDPHSDARAHRMISWIGSSLAHVIGNWEEHARECISFMIARGLWSTVTKTWGIDAGDDTSVILERVGRRLGKLRSGGMVDREAAGKAFIDSFASGKLGRVSLERPRERPIWEMLK